MVRYFLQEMRKTARLIRKAAGNTVLSKITKCVIWLIFAQFVKGNRKRWFCQQILTIALRWQTEKQLFKYFQSCNYYHIMFSAQCFDIDKAE